MCESEEEVKVWVMAPHLISESIIVCRVHSDFSFLFDRTFFIYLFYTDVYLVLFVFRQ